VEAGSELSEAGVKKWQRMAWRVWDHLQRRKTFSMPYSTQTHEAVARILGMSVTSVHRAYARLYRLGWLEYRPQLPKDKDLWPPPKDFKLPQDLDAPSGRGLAYLDMPDRNHPDGHRMMWVRRVEAMGERLPYDRVRLPPKAQAALLAGVGFSGGARKGAGRKSKATGPDSEKAPASSEVQSKAIGPESKVREAENNSWNISRGSAAPPPRESKAIGAFPGKLRASEDLQSKAIGPESKTTRPEAPVPAIPPESAPEGGARKPAPSLIENQNRDPSKEKKLEIFATLRSQAPKNPAPVARAKSTPSISGPTPTRPVIPVTPLPTRLARLSMPPEFPFPARAKLPPAPRLLATDSDEQVVKKLFAAYQCVHQHRLGKCWLKLRPSSRTVLLQAGKLLRDREVAPISWVNWRFNEHREKNGPNTAPRLENVFMVRWMEGRGLDEMLEHRDRCEGGTPLPSTEEAKALYARWRRMASGVSACAEGDLDAQRAAVAAEFRNGCASLEAARKKIGAAAQGSEQALRRQVEEGVFVWDSAHRAAGR
jgi:hypothetical protein